MKTCTTFGEMLRQLREAKGLTLREVAEALGIDTSMLGKIEKGSRNPSKLFLEKCALFFEVEKEELRIAFLSDTVAYQIGGEANALQVLKVAEEKVKYELNRKKHEL